MCLDSMNELVSIITPCFNSEDLIEETIRSVQEQDYTNWEMIIIDDCSSDGTSLIVEKFTRKDKRIKFIQLRNNSGAAVARNKGLDEAQGRFIAYLDADDLWVPNKLTMQIDFLVKNGYGFSCCDYEKIDIDGVSLNKYISMPKSMSYNQFLRNTIIQTVGVIIDLDIIDKKLLIMPNVRRGQDAATWLQILKSGTEFKGQNIVLAKYRRAPKSLSSNKIKAFKRTWYIYRHIEKLSFIKSFYCAIGWAYNAIKKRIYFNR